MYFSGIAAIQYVSSLGASTNPTKGDFSPSNGKKIKISERNQALLAALLPLNLYQKLEEALVDEVNFSVPEKFSLYRTVVAWGPEKEAIDRLRKEADAKLEQLEMPPTHWFGKMRRRLLTPQRKRSLKNTIKEKFLAKKAKILNPTLITDSIKVVYDTTFDRFFARPEFIPNGMADYIITRKSSE